MKKLNFLYILLACVLTITSCVKDEVEELQDEMNDIENALGSNEGLVMKFETSTTANEEVVKNTTFLLKAAGNNEAIFPNGDGTYTVYIERFADVEWTDGAWIYFEFDPTTKEIINPRSGAYFNDKFGNRINQNFNPNNDVNLTCTIVVKAINLETGSVTVVVTSASKAEYTNNEYTGKAMSMTLKFSGKIALFNTNPW